MEIFTTAINDFQLPSQRASLRYPQGFLVRLWSELKKEDDFRCKKNTSWKEVRLRQA